MEVGVGRESGEMFKRYPKNPPVDRFTTAAAVRANVVAASETGRRAQTDRETVRLRWDSGGVVHLGAIGRSVR